MEWVSGIVVHPGCALVGQAQARMKMEWVWSRRGWLFSAFPWFKWAIYALLTLNVYLFVISQTLIEGLDSLAWVVLLLLLEWETSRLGRQVLPRWERWLIHGLRIGAIGVILWAAWQYSTAEYITAHGRLDQFNAWLWIAVVLALEYEVRWPGFCYRWEWMLRNAVKTALYGGLMVIAVMWGLSDEPGSLFDFYDAMLWILCFFVIELNMFRFESEQMHMNAGHLQDDVNIDG